MDDKRKRNRDGRGHERTLLWRVRRETPAMGSAGLPLGATSPAVSRTLTFIERHVPVAAAASEPAMAVAAEIVSEPAIELEEDVASPDVVVADGQPSNAASSHGGVIVPWGPMADIVTARGHGAGGVRAITVVDPVPAHTPTADIEAVPFDVEGRLSSALVVTTAPTSSQAAAFRVMRHRLTERDDPRALLVTSAHDGDGKSVGAANLALALGEGGRARVLLIDAHVRRPRLGKLFGVDPPPTHDLLAQVARLAREGDTRVKVAALGGLGLHLLTARAAEPNEKRELDAKAFRAALKLLRGAYDHVVIDAPAVLTSPDVSLVEDAVDGVLFVVPGRRARGPALRRAMEQIAPSRMLGTLLLGA